MSEYIGNSLVSQENDQLLTPFAQEHQSMTRGTRTRDVITLFFSALFSLILRLWIATLSISMVMSLLRRVPLNPLLHHSGRIIQDRPVSIQLQNTAWNGIPSLFGRIIEEPIKGIHFLTKGPLYHVSHDACYPFTVQFPEYKIIDESPANENITTDAIETTEWIGIVQRGGCPFDQKVLRMQQAGFKAVFVFNHDLEPMDQTVRMSAHSHGGDIHVFSAFLSRLSGFQMIQKSQSFQNPMIVIQPFQPIWISKEILKSGLLDMLVLLLLVILTGSGFLIFGLMINVGHNMATHGEMLLSETIHEASMMILHGQLNLNPPKLEKIPFPIYILQKIDFDLDWIKGGIKGHEHCPICIEEFDVGNSIRPLPCKHLFHATW